MNIAVTEQTRSKQGADQVLMVRPDNFGFNYQTAATNSYQQHLNDTTNRIVNSAKTEHQKLIDSISEMEVKVNIYSHPKDISTELPDAVFVNNWISTHPSNLYEDRKVRIVIYPMLTANRRAEVNSKIITDIYDKQQIAHELIDLREDLDINSDIALEGTGSINFDHQHRIAYACLSPRTDKELFIHVCQQLGYEPVWFTAKNSSGEQIYHTNIFGAVGSRWAVVSRKSLPDTQQSKRFLEALQDTDHTLIDISAKQMDQNYSGNLLELRSAELSDKSVVAMSTRARAGFSTQQLQIFKEFGIDVTATDLETIETVGGGSVRCCLAEIYT